MVVVPVHALLFFFAILLSACTADLGAACVTDDDCGGTAICVDGACAPLDMRDGGRDTTVDTSTRDTASETEVDTGCFRCSADEVCFEGRCVRCDGVTRFDGCSCSEGSECRTSLCSGGLCAACTADADCGTGTCNVETGECSRCGADGESCCDEDPVCGAGLSCAPTGVCSACGLMGQACCDDGMGGGSCFEGGCLGDGTCGACGARGQTPCAGGVCDAGLAPRSGSCQPCGSLFTGCCTTEPFCQPGLVCGGTLCRSER